jgi:hypothetical protein
MEDIGSNLSGGIVFTWANDGKLIYGVPEHANTLFSQYDPATGAKSRLWQVTGNVTRLAAPNDQVVDYCFLAADAQSSPTKPTDPAYRYDQSTFHFWDKQPWRDGKGFVGGHRPDAAPEPAESCFEENSSSQNAKQIPPSEIPSINPLRPPMIFGSALDSNSFVNKTYDGNPVEVTFPAPDHHKILFATRIPQVEDSTWERSYLYFVQEATASSIPKKIFAITGERENGIQMVFWAPDSKAILCIRRSLDRTRIVRFDVVTGQESELLNTDWGIYRPSMSPNGQYLYAVTEKPNIAKQLSRIDLMTGQMLLIDTVNEQLDSVQIPPYLSIRQFNHYNDELTGYLFFPPGFSGQSRLPFVAIRGQDWNSFCDGGTGVEFPGMVMAMNGFVVLFFEPSSKHYPPSEHGNGAFSNLRFESPVESLTRLIEDLDKKGWIDPKKTGIAGLSAGADIVNYAAGFSNTFTIGSATTGEVYAPANYFTFDDHQVIGLFSNRYGLPYPDLVGLPIWAKVSTSLNASRSTMPLLFQPGDAEAPMTVPQHIAWEHAGIPVETYVYPDEGHIKIHPRNRDYVMTRNLQWFDYWLRNVNTPAPNSSDQFARWEEMRTKWNVHLISREVKQRNAVSSSQ